MDDIKLEELRLLFDRENSRKQSLENKASYFLGCISIVMTLICTFSNSITLDNLIFTCYGWGFVTYFLVTIGFCISIFSPKDYYHPFDLEDSEKLEKSFNEYEYSFKKKLNDQYLVSVYMNHSINDELVIKLKNAIIYFILFLFCFFLMEVML